MVVEATIAADEKSFLQLNDISAYKTGFHLSNYVWDIVVRWNYFERDTVGKQFVRAVDSISANLAEGFGRYTKKEKIQFYRYSYGSIKESLDWNEKAKMRKLLSMKQYAFIFSELQKLPRDIHSLMRFTNSRLTM